MAWIAEEMGRKVSWPLVVYVDNAAGVSFQHSTCASSKLRGVFDMADKWVQELKDGKVVDAVKVDTTKNLADMLTKCLAYPVRNSLEVLLLDIAKSIAKAQAI